MPGISSVLDIGKWALFGSQAAIETTSNNIANVNTEGYSRRTVVFEENYSLDYRPGQLGTGAEATQVVRHFDVFIERQYTEKYSLTQRYDTLWENLRSVESLVNESSTDGIHSLMSQFFTDWQDLSLRPDDYASREALLANTQSLVSLLRSTDDDLNDLQNQVDEAVSHEVDQANEIIQQIAAINVELNIHDEPGSNNANQLLDRRDKLVRDLSELMDVTVLDPSGDGGRGAIIPGQDADLTIVTKEGHTLVQGGAYWEIKYEGPQVSESLRPSSTFDGDINFSGDSSFEYTIEVVNGGDVSTGSGATFRVSVDGGHTWLKDLDGNEKHFYARPESNKVNVEGVDIWFENASNPLTAGDKFTVMPKSGLYWYQNTSDKMNITPITRTDGTDDGTRLTGGTITGMLTFYSDYVGRYRDKMNAMTESFVWEVNRLHSQGAGLERLNSTVGEYSVYDPDLALGSDSSGLPWNDRLSNGNMMVYIYDATTGELSNSSSYGPLDFDPNTAGIQNFDPSIHSLNDVAAAFNNTFGSNLTATVVNNRLQITAESGYRFGFGNDTTGVLAGLGINTFFDGHDNDSLAINDEVLNSPTLLAAGHINGAGEANYGDNVTATNISALSYKKVTISGFFDSTSNQTLTDYYATVVATIGGDTASVKFVYEYNESLAKDLDERQLSVSGVNLDEEMTDLIKYQNSYRAAAKLVTTADQMLQVILGMKQ